MTHSKTKEKKWKKMSFRERVAGGWRNYVPWPQVKNSICEHCYSYNRDKTNPPICTPQQHITSLMLEYTKKYNARRAWEWKYGDYIDD